MSTFIGLLGSFFLDFLIGEVVYSINECTLTFSTACITVIPKIGSDFIGALA